MHHQSNFPLSTIKFNSYTPIGRQQQKKVSQILNNLIDLPQAAQFLHPVAWRQLELDDYPQIIKHPMNLLKVQQKIKARDYNTVQQALDHIQLIWDNCKEYNPQGYFFQIAEKLQKTFKKMIKNYLPAIQIDVNQQRSLVHNQPVQQTPTHQMTRKNAPPIPPTRSGQQKQPNKQIQQRPQPQYIQESKSQKQESEQQPQIEQIPLSQKNRFHQRLKQITQQQLAQIVSMIQQYCSQGFKHISGGRYQIVMDNIDAQSFKKLSEKLDDFIQNEKMNGGLGNKKVKV